MESPSEMDMLKDIPGFKAILRAVLRTQMQYLASQLSAYGDVETIVLAASLTDCTLSHLSSEGGNGFLEARDDIKAQFLRHCLSKSEKNKVTTHYPGDSIGTSQPAMAPVSNVAKSWSALPIQPQYQLNPNAGQLSVLALNQPHTAGVALNQTNTGMVLSNEIQDNLAVPALYNSNLHTSRKGPKHVHSQKRLKIKPESLQTKENSEKDTVVASQQNSIEIKIEPIDVEENKVENVQDDELPKSGDTAKSYVDVDLSEMSEGERDQISEGDSSFKIENDVDEHAISTNMLIIEPDAQDSSVISSSSNFDDYVYRRKRRKRAPPEENVPDCEICGTKFKNNSSYRRHIRKHTGENPWSCHLCGQGFYRKDDLNTHILRHAGRKPYTCRICGIGSLRLSQLRAHMVRCHPVATDDNIGGILY